MHPAYKVVWFYDGCPTEDASIPLGSIDECKHFIRVKQKLFKETLRDQKISLQIVDLSTERVMSYVL
jgi:hypothetical protein